MTETNELSREDALTRYAIAYPENPRGEGAPCAAEWGTPWQRTVPRAPFVSFYTLPGREDIGCYGVSAEGAHVPCPSIGLGLAAARAAWGAR